MADKNISSLPAAASINDDSKIPAEQQGEAVYFTGSQLKKYAKEAGAVGGQASVAAAEAAAELAEEAKGETERFMEATAEREEHVGNLVRLAELYKNEANSARTSAKNYASSADRAAEDAEAAQAAAEKARDEAVEAAGNAGGGTGGTTDHDKLENRDAEDQHPMRAITGLEAALEGKQPTGDYALRKELPSVPVKSVNGKTGEVELGAKDVGADAEGAAAKEVSGHNTSDAAHSDIRLLITNLTTRLNTLANSEDVDLDQMAELVAYIKDNRGLIEQITTGKVGVNDIVNNLTTNTANKPLSAAQGVALKALIDAITVPTKVSQLANDKGYLTEYTETDPTVPAWAKAATKPSYSKSEVGLGNVADERQYSTNNPPPYPVTSVNGQTGDVKVSVPTVVQTTGESTTDVMSQKAVTEKLSQLSDEKVGKEYVDTAEYKQSIADLVVAHLVGQPIVGVVDENNNIILNGTLAVGTYTLKYEGENGEYSDVVELTITEEDKIAYTNVLPLATDATGEVYNGVGYKNGYRISTSSFDKAETKVSCTGLIPIKVGDVLRFKDCNFMVTPASSYGTSLYFYDNDKTYLASVTDINIKVRVGYTTAGTEYTSITLTPTDAWLPSAKSDQWAYVRISTDSLSEDSIITINQEIV